MNEQDFEKEVGRIVGKLLEDYQQNKIIDATDFYSRPDKEQVKDLVQSLLQIILPGYLRDRSIKTYSPASSMTVLIEDTFYRLNKQISLAIALKCEREHEEEERRKDESRRICIEFFDRIPMIRSYVETDLKAAFVGDPAAGSYEEIILAYPGFLASTVSRIAHELYLLKVPVLPRLMTEYAHSLTGIDIHPGARLGKYFFIDHGTGVVIGETSIIGDNVKLYQGVTIGALSTRDGQKLAGVKRHPTIEDNVVIYAGATVLGGETVIGHDAVIGGNAFVTSSVPAGMRVSIKNPELEYRPSKKKTELKG